MSAQDNAKIAKASYEAFNNREFEQWAAAYLTDEAATVNVPLNVTFHGPDGYSQFSQGWVTAFPDGKVEITKMVAGDEGVATEFRGRGTHTGPLVGPAGEIPATGRSIDVPFCQIMQIKNGKVVSSRLYFDAATMMGQLGLI